MLGWKLKVELVERLDPRAGATSASPPCSRRVVAQHDLGGKQILDRFARGHRSAVGLGQDAVHDFQRSGHFQVRQHLSQPSPPITRRRLHRTASEYSRKGRRCTCTVGATKRRRPAWGCRAPRAR